jgi:polyamine oxidase
MANEVVGPVDRVIVVGAGIAGLAAAVRLRRAGIACRVLEARDQVGGRLHTVDLAGVPVDLGGSWIHHPIGNPMSSLCAEYGIARDPGDPMPSLTAYDRVERRRLDRAEIETSFRLVFDAFDEAVESLRDRLGTNATALDAIAAFIDERGFVGADARRARQALLAEVEADAGDRADNESLAGFGYVEQYGGDLFGDLPRGGYRSVVEALAAGLDITFNAEAVAVRVDADGIGVTCADGSVEIGSHVVVTVPLGVLKRGSPRFDPPLPTPMQVAVDALGFGRYEKIALRFEAPFWRHDGISHLMVFPSDDNEPAMWVFDLDAFGAGPVLCAHLFHSLTPYALDRSSVEAVTWFREVLAEAVGHPVPEPIATAVTSWAHDPFTGGAYTHCPPGADPLMLDLLGRPVNGRLLLAGEHTESARTGYADGAYTSGLRAAGRLGA